MRVFHYLSLLFLITFPHFISAQSPDPNQQQADVIPKILKSEIEKMLNLEKLPLQLKSEWGNLGPYLPLTFTPSSDENPASGSIPSLVAIALAGEKFIEDNIALKHTLSLVAQALFPELRFVQESVSKKSAMTSPERTEMRDGKQEIIARLGQDVTYTTLKPLSSAADISYKGRVNDMTRSALLLYFGDNKAARLEVLRITKLIHSYYNEVMSWSGEQDDDEIIAYMGEVMEIAAIDTRLNQEEVDFLKSISSLPAISNLQVGLSPTLEASDFPDLSAYTAPLVGDDLFKLLGEKAKPTSGAAPAILAALLKAGISLTTEDLNVQERKRNGFVIQIGMKLFLTFYSEKLKENIGNYGGLEADAKIKTDQKIWDFLNLIIEALRLSYTSFDSPLPKTIADLVDEFKDKTPFDFIEPFAGAELGETDEEKAAAKQAINQELQEETGLNPARPVFDYFGGPEKLKTLLNMLFKRIVFYNDLKAPMVPDEIKNIFLPVEAMLIGFLAMDLKDLDGERNYLMQTMAGRYERFTDTLRDPDTVVPLTFSEEEASGTAADVMAYLDLLLAEEGEQDPLNISTGHGSFSYDHLKSFKAFLAKRLMQAVFEYGTGIGRISKSPSGLVMSSDRARSKLLAFLKAVLKVRFGIEEGIAGPKVQAIMLKEFDETIERLIQFIAEWLMPTSADYLPTDEEKLALKKEILPFSVDGLEKEKQKEKETQDQNNQIKKLDFDDIEVRTEYSASFDVLENELKSSPALSQGVNLDTPQEDEFANPKVAERLQEISLGQMSGEIEGLGDGLKATVEAFKKDWPSYKYGWMITSVIKQDEKAAAERCVKKFKADEGLDKMLQKPRDGYSAVMVTRADSMYKKGEADPLMTRKKHYCGVVLNIGEE